MNLAGNFLEIQNQQKLRSGTLLSGRRSFSSDTVLFVEHPIPCRNVSLSSQTSAQSTEPTFKVHSAHLRAGGTAGELRSHARTIQPYYLHWTGCNLLQSPHIVCARVVVGIEKSEPTTLPLTYALGL